MFYIYLIAGREQDERTSIMGGRAGKDHKINLIKITIDEKIMGI